MLHNCGWVNPHETVDSAGDFLWFYIVEVHCYVDIYISSSKDFLWFLILSTLPIRPEQSVSGWFGKYANKMTIQLSVNESNKCCLAR